MKNISTTSTSNNLKVSLNSLIASYGASENTYILTSKTFESSTNASEKNTYTIINDNSLVSPKIIYDEL